MKKELVFRDKRLPLDRVYIMGILNVTPDSFSDGGKWQSDAVGHALDMVAQGADIIDIGGESTRPGHTPVSSQEELARVLPVLVELRAKTDAVISVDTRHEEVARKCLEAGADIINSVAEFECIKPLMRAAADFKAGFIYTHVVRGFEEEHDAKRAIKRQFARAERLARLCGIGRNSLVIDPGIGFYKTTEQNVFIVENLEEFCGGYPLLMALSRKRFIGEITDKPVEERDAASAVLNAISVQKGADIVRVHDVEANRDAVRVAYELRGRKWTK